MTMKVKTLVMMVMLSCSTPVMADSILSLPKLNDSTFGYGKSVDGAVSDKLFYLLHYRFRIFLLCRRCA